MTDEEKAKVELAKRLKELMAIINSEHGCSVTQRVRKIKQPYGGYVRPKDFEKAMLDGGGIEDLNAENVHTSLIGMSVDYLTRFLTGTPVDKAFQISQKGAVIVKEEKLFNKLIKQVRGLDEKSIKAAIQLSGFDSAFRAGRSAYRPVKEINPDSATIENIKIMVLRSLNFFNLYGPKVLDGLTFEGGYTKCVSSGDGDFLTEDTLWDFKVSRQKINSKQTLQLLMYWRMGLHSIHPEYGNVKFLGIYNPRMNIVYKFDVSKILDEVITEVETEVIGY